MTLLRGGFLLALSLCPAWAQCPSINFLQGSVVQLFASGSGGFASGLQRQSDGSFTQQRYQAISPYNKTGTVANFQSALVNCTAAAPRSFHPPAQVLMTDQLGVSSRDMVAANLVGSGTPAGLAVVFSGGGGPPVDSLAVVLANADASMKSNRYYPVPEASSLLVADFNHDGSKDVAVVFSQTQSSSGGVAVFIGNGDGTLKNAVIYGGHNGVSSATALDFDKDGNVDLALANTASGDVSVLLGKGDGTFRTAVNYAVGTFPSVVVAADFNGDGKGDILAAADRAIAVLLGNGDGTFRAAKLTSTRFSAGSVAIADFNKDGKLDIVASIFGDSTVLASLQGDGTGGFGSESDYGIPFQAFSLLATDVDGDGNPDLVLGSGHPDVLVPEEYRQTVTVLFGRGDGSLIGPPSYPATSLFSSARPIFNSIASADFNRDGIPDVATAAQFGGTVDIFLGRAGASFDAARPLTIPASGGSTANPQSVVARDLNGDGKADLVFADPGGGGRVYVALGNGDGSFQNAVSYSAGGTPGAVTVADLDGDGKPDLAVALLSASQNGAGSLGILTGSGNGTFGAVKTTAGAGVNPVGIVAADFNRDGKVDVAIVNGGTFGANNGSISVFLNQGSGNFPNPTAYGAGSQPTSLATADFNGDGIPDLAVTTSGANFDFFVGILMGKGDGTFKPVSLIDTDFGPNVISSGDLNGDGKTDLIVGHCCGDVDVTYLLGKGDGTFQSEVHLPAAESPAVVALIDVNADGKPDLVAGNGYLTIFQNISTIQSGGAPAPVSVSPAAGSGQNQTLTFTFSAPGGYQSLGVVNVLINNFLDGRFACYLAYSQPLNVLYLVNDSGTALDGMVLNGSGSGSIANSQCSIANSGSSASGSGNALTLRLNVTFGATFGGNKVVYMAARDTAETNSGWLPLGVWQVPGAPSTTSTSVTGMNPASGAGHTRSFTFTFKDSKGYQDLGVVNVLLNDYLNGTQACYLAYSRPSNVLFLVNDPGTALLPGLVLSGSGSVGNSQCTISGAGSTATGTGDTLTLTLNVTFGSSWAGPRIFYLAARDVNEANNTGWQSMGAWVVQ